jgi:hypothetical protein
MMASAAMAIESQILEIQPDNDLPEAFEDAAEIVETELPDVLGQSYCCKAFNIRAGLSLNAAQSFFADGYNTIIVNAYNDGAVNSNVCNNLSNAIFGQIYYRELYFDPLANDTTKSAA